MTLIQRFGSALNLNIHFHMLFLDGVYVDGADGSSPRFRWVKVPTSAELNHLTHVCADEEPPLFAAVVRTRRSDDARDPRDQRCRSMR